MMMSEKTQTEREISLIEKIIYSDLGLTKKIDGIYILDSLKLKGLL